MPISIPRISTSLAVITVVLQTFLFSGCTTTDQEYLVYVGTYTGKGSDGIYAYRFNPANGALTPIGLAAKTENPSYLVIDAQRKFLYAVNELGNYEGQSTGAISVFSIDHASASLTLLQQVSSLGAAPCHLSFDQSGRYLMVANYTGGDAAVFPIGDNGQLGAATAFIQSSGSSADTLRQAGPHAHAIQPTPDNRFVMITDLGTDKVLTFRLNSETGSLEAHDSLQTSLSPGSGPRHLVVSSSGTFAYVINELTSTVSCFARDPETGKMEHRQTMSILPDDFSGGNTAAEITMSGDGKFLYVSNRGHDSIGIFSIAPDDGSLNSIEWVSSGGKTPRHFEIDPTGKWLLAANQNSNNLILFEIDQNTGRLLLKEQTRQVNSPVCVRFVPIQ